MRRSACAMMLALFACADAACADEIIPLTQLVVVVDSDLKVPSELDGLSLEFGGVMKVNSVPANLVEEALPRYIGLVHAGGPVGPVMVTVRGLLGSKTVLQRVATASFVKDKTLLLRVPLQRACVAVESCTNGMTCDAGSCVSPQLNDLPEWTGQVKPFVSAGTAGRPAAGSGGSGAGSSAPKGGAGGSAGSAGKGGSGGSNATNLPPTCAITSPKNNDTFAQGELITFSGSCSDPEVGTLQTGLRWVSSRDGELGTTSRIMRSTLSADKHNVTLCATDPTDSTKSACSTPVAITVNSLPGVTAVINAITQGTTTSSPYQSTLPIVVSGSATGVDPVALLWRDSMTGGLGSDPMLTMNQPLVGKHLLTFTATDSRQGTASASMTFSVLEAGKSQLIAQFVAVNQTLSADGSARVDVLSSASVSVYAAATTPGKLYYFDPTEDPSTVMPTLLQTTAPALIRDVFLPAATGSAYVALSAGYEVCPYVAGTGTDATMCTTKLASDDTTRALRFKAGAQDCLLVGTNKGLFVSDIADTSKDTKYLTDIAIRDLANDDSAAWIASADGLYTYDLTATNPLGASPRRQTIDAGGPGNALSAVAVGTGGVVWVGSTLGLARLIPATSAWTSWRAAVVSGGAPSLASNDVRSIAVARGVSIGGVVRDVVWIATAAGVSRFDPTLPSFTTFTTDDGLPSNSIQSVVVLSNGDKVFGTDTGVALYKGP